MEDPGQKLMDELRSLLDETIILSISGDYDLEDPEQFSAAREVLLTISKDVEAEEATGFNPSGLGADSIVDIGPSTQDDAEASGANSSDVKSVGGLTVTTENSIPPSLISRGSSRTSTNETPGLIHVDIFDGLTDSEKEEQLIQMFVSLKPIDVKLCLQKSKGDANLAIDELLNLQWLEQTGQRPKGVDGFYISDDNAPNKRKKKGRKKKKVAKVIIPQATDPENASGEIGNSDAVQNDYIALISDRLNLLPSDAARTYQQQNGSPGATVVKVLDNYFATGLAPPEPYLAPDTRREIDKFPWIPSEYVKATFEICSTQDHAMDIIRILADYFEKPSYLKYDVPYSLVASGAEASELVNNLSPKETQMSPTNIRPPTIDPPRRALNQPANLQAAAAASNAFAESRNHSFSSAAAAFKKGRSDPLFRAVGAFYAERAREQATSHRQASTIEANYLVDQKSTEDMIDLHGVTVQDGVEIARDRVWKWWQGLGEERARKAKQGFTVVTGIGRHSADGKSRLRINVFKALVADGWKVEVMTGKYLVTGRKK